MRYQSSESYMSPSVSESIPPWTASEMMPLPAGPARHVTADTTVPFVEYRAYAPVVAPAESVQTFRPVVAPTVPAGYVVGQGFIGQPKLYKPGPTGAEFSEIHQPVTGWIRSRDAPVDVGRTRKKERPTIRPTRGRIVGPNTAQPLRFLRSGRLRAKKRPAF